MAAKKFNLIPQKEQDTKLVQQYIKTTKKILTVVTVLFSISLLLSIGLIINFSQKLTALKAENSDLKRNITSLEATEQSLILVKDRLTKTQEILADSENFDNFEKQYQLTNELPPDIYFSASEISRGTSTFILNTSSGLALSSYLKSLKETYPYSNLSLNSITFNIQRGFTLNLEII